MKSENDSFEQKNSENFNSSSTRRSTAKDTDNSVKVRILGKEYSIKSDRLDVVKAVAERINAESNSILAANPSSNQIDLAAQVAFQLAVDLNSAEKKLAALEAQIDNQAERLARKIEESIKK